MRSSFRGPLPIALASACLAVLAGCGKDSVTAFLEPALSLTCAVAPSSGVAPLAVTFSARAEGGQSFALSIQWGDGSSGSDPAHVYTRPGSFNVSATATRPGQSATCGQTVNVQAPAPKPPSRIPIFKFKVSPNPPAGPAPLGVSFNACETVDPDGDALTFSFDFGDGHRTESSFCRHDHTYGPGRFPAFICATDGEPDHLGCASFEVNAQ